MTDSEIRDQVVAALKQTTVGYQNKNWKTPPAGTQWEKALTLLAQIGATPAPTPAPVPPSGGRVGLYQLADSLGVQSHLLGGTYTGPIVANLDDVVLLNRATVATSKLGFVYTGAATSDSIPGSLIDLTNPQAWLTKWLPVAAQYGVGLMIDNVQPSLGPNLLSFLKTVYPACAAKGVLLMGNVSVSDSPLTNAASTGMAWKTNAATYGPYLDWLMLEGWQENLWPVSDTKLRVRGTATDQQWDAWQSCVKGAPAGKRLMLVTYGDTGSGGLGVQAGVYGRASALVGGLDPLDCFCYVNATGNTGGSTKDSYSPAWTVAAPKPTVDPVAGTATL
jgi:hypothetical protein